MYSMIGLTREQEQSIRNAMQAATEDGQVLVVPDFPDELWLRCNAGGTMSAVDRYGREYVEDVPKPTQEELEDFLDWWEATARRISGSSCSARFTE